MPLQIITENLNNELTVPLHYFLSEQLARTFWLADSYDYKKPLDLLNNRLSCSQMLQIEKENIALFHSLFNQSKEVDLVLHSQSLTDERNFKFKKWSTIYRHYILNKNFLFNLRILAVKSTRACSSDDVFLRSSNM